VNIAISILSFLLFLLLVCVYRIAHNSHVSEDWDSFGKMVPTFGALVLCTVAWAILIVIKLVRH
jgi:hypothetical protein